MLLSKILQAQCVKVPLVGLDKRQAIEELVDLLAEADIVGASDLDSLKSAVWQRETTRTTGIGHGLAIPHGKSDAVEHLVMAIGKPSEPIDFQSIDGQPVNLIILLISPPSETSEHVQTLARISRLMSDAQFRHAMVEADNAQTLYQLICDHESALEKT